MRVHSRSRQPFAVLAAVSFTLAACGGDKTKDQAAGSRRRAGGVRRAWR